MAEVVCKGWTDTYVRDFWLRRLLQATGPIAARDVLAHPDEFFPEGHKSQRVAMLRAALGRLLLGEWVRIDNGVLTVTEKTWR